MQWFLVLSRIVYWGLLKLSHSAPSNLLKKILYVKDSSMEFAEDEASRD